MTIEVRQLTIYSRVIPPHDAEETAQPQPGAENRDDGSQTGPHAAASGTLALHHLHTEPRER
ncbi:hypothetical protein [Dickeya chrysanthemi]|uniref:Uncharacterized protein n=1 Tax=Dickeya chrysanthemi TaxID=556 RepID=A0ABU8JHF3_DICCH|nr:hypothetical protein [Dickeya chrysanthemi]MBX9446308.1 hypothetical protein [Dickeya chrysanthemi]MCA7006717.1 hypothetical protein [Dickeya chrysanthemi]